MTIALQIDNETVLIDDVDLDLVSWNWYLDYNNVTPRVVGRKPSKRGERRKNSNLLKLHRVVISRRLGRELSPYEQVRHMDKNPFNNTRNNVVLCSEFIRGKNEAN